MTRRLLTVLFPTVLLLCAAACQSDGDTPSDAVTRTDSAGIEVVTNLTDPGSLPHRALALIPELDITSDEESGLLLFQVSAIEPLEGDRIAVGSSGTGTVLVFDGEGELITSIGREGDGPGEFRSIQSVLALPNDSLAVYDARRGRLTVFSLEGAVGRMVDLSGLPLGDWSTIHRFPDGFALIGVASIGEANERGIYRSRAPSFRLGLAGDSLASYGELPGMEMFYNEVALGALTFGSTLFTGTRGDRLVVGLADSPELREYASTGALARLIRWPDHDRQVTEARIAEFVEHMVQSLPEAQREQGRAQLGGMPYSPTEPAYYDLVVADNGAVWVGDYPGHAFRTLGTPGPARRWIVIDSTGTLTEVVETPPGFQLMAVADGRAFGVQIDELGVESVRVYAVETR